MNICKNNSQNLDRREHIRNELLQSSQTLAERLIDLINEVDLLRLGLKLNCLRSGNSVLCSNISPNPAKKSIIGLAYRNDRLQDFADFRTRVDRVDIDYSYSRKVFVCGSQRSNDFVRECHNIIYIVSLGQ